MTLDEKVKVDLVVAYSRAAGLPEPYARCAAFFPGPYRRWDDRWHVLMPPNNLLKEVYLEADEHPALDTFWNTDRVGYVEFLAERREPIRAALADLPLTVPAGVGPSPVFHPLLEPMCREWARWVTVALAWFWQGEAAPEIPVFPGTEGITDEQVARLMAEAQNEIDRETNHPHSWGIWQRPKKELRLCDLPWERQRRLAEARRFVFYRYGITGSVWRSGRWSLWQVPRYRDKV